MWFFVAGVGPSAWRWMYIIGILPALLTWWIRKRINEPPQWVESDRKRREGHFSRFTLTEVLRDPRMRRNTIAAFLMSTTTTLAWWGISSWVPPYVASLALKEGLPAAQWASFAGMSYNFGAVCGYIALGFCADAWGRKPVTIAWFALAWLLTPVLFLWTHNLTLILIVAAINAVFTLGQYTWCPTWLPEAYPTHVRATAVSFCFNAPRFIAFSGPLLAGTLITYFGDYGRAAVIVSTIYVLGIAAAPFFPETRNKPLPQ
jgi:MFS family permease